MTAKRISSKPKKRTVAAKKPVVAKKTVAKKPAPRADFGEPIDPFFAKQPPHLRAILEELRKLVKEVAPEASSSIKWGMPVYTLNGAMMCALAAYQAHVNLILSGPREAFADPESRLSGEGKTGSHLKLATLNELPREAVRAWLGSAAQLARNRG
jgi:hypothetical protein